MVSVDVGYDDDNNGDDNDGATEKKKQHFWQLMVGAIAG